MHNNFYFFRQLSARLNNEIVGFTVVSCFSQSKDELIIELNNSKRSFFIKANLSSPFSCLSFPREFHRARKNSIELFEEIILKKIIGVKQFENERSFALQLEEGFSLLFKMHSNFSNIILFKNEVVIKVFRNHLKSDFDFSLHGLDRKIDFSREGFEKKMAHVNTLYFTFGKTVWEYLRQRSFDQLEIELRWKLLQDTIRLLEKPTYYLIENQGRLIFSLLPLGTIVKEETDPLVAITEFEIRFVRDEIFYSEKRDALNSLKVRLKNNENYIIKSEQKLGEIDGDHHYQLWADLIMANLHNIKSGQEKIVLNDFYEEKPTEIRLKKELTPQKNAEVFYRKSKNRQLEVDKLRETISGKKTEISELFSSIDAIEAAPDLKTLRSKMAELGLNKSASSPLENLPYREFEHKGYKIWVGKNAETNDKLTLKYSFKEDLWLHAKDVPGSHVLIKHQARKNFPKDVIEYAASLAAFYSKRKNESLCPVAITPKKFVRKRKGDPAGAVAVEREEVILVEPFKGVFS